MTPASRWTALAVALALALAAPALVAPIGEASNYDGGITSSAGTFIRHGLLPYRDFWLLYGPLTGYMAALIGFIGHDDLLPIRIVGLAVTATTAGLAALISMRFVHPVVAVSLAVIVAVSPLAFIGLDLQPWPLAICLSLAAIAIGRRDDHRRLFLAGAMCGMAGLARQDIGVYTVIAVSVANRSPRPLLGAAAVWLPVGLWLLSQVPIEALWAQLVVYPAIGPAQYRSLAPPSLIDIINPTGWLRTYLYYLPTALIAAAAVRMWRTRSVDTVILALVGLALAVRPQATLRSDLAHIAMALGPALLLGPYVLTGIVRSTRGRFVTGLVFAPLGLVAVTAGLGALSPQTPYSSSIQQASAIVGSLTEPGEPIFVGLAANRHAFLNPMVAYYLADRPTGVRDSMYNPGVTNTQEVQRRMVDDLRSNDVRFLILDVRYATCWEPANLSRIPGSTVLDDAIDRDFRVVVDLGSAVIMARRDVSVVEAPVVDRTDPQIPRTEGALICSDS